MPKIFRSGSEERLFSFLKSNKITHKYEPYRIPFKVSLVRKYLPDFVLANGIILEVKGRFTTADRMKHLYIRKDNLFLDIRFVFDNPKSKLYKGSKTTYGDWCDKHGFEYCSSKDVNVILKWAKEKLE